MDKFIEMEMYAKILNIPILREQSRNILLDTLKKINPKTILEIGTAIGYSGGLMLKTLPNAKLTTIEILPTAIEVAKQNFADLRVLDRVEIINGDATEIIKNMAETGQKFDFIFLDGPKAQYIKQLPYLLTILNKNGSVLADNVLFMGQVLSNEYPKHKHRTMVLNLRKFIETVQNDKNLESKLYQIEDGMLYFKKIE